MAISEETIGLARKLALKNAIDYGSAKEGAIISKVLARHPELKPYMGELSQAVKAVVSEINLMDRKVLESEYSRYAGEFESLEREKAEKSSRHRFGIEGAEKGKLVTRFPPEPSGYMHIGHAKPLFIEDELRRAYDGKLFLYFDDTNPDNEKQEFVDAFIEDLKWLGLSFDREYYASDNLEMLYGYALEAIKRKGAYVCTCGGEEIKKGRLSGIACRHKSQQVSENEGLWKKMLEGSFGDGEAILRWNGEMKAANTSMRDPTLFRIKHAVHYRQGEKYFVWPNYDFCTPVIDSVNGITDVIRSKEYEMRDELHLAILDLLGLRKPRITSISRLEIANNVTSKRKIRSMIADGLITGWDDPRLVTIRALRRRGITAQAIREFALSSGMGKSESTAEMESLLSMNRKLIDATAKRLFFIEDPMEMDVSNTGGVTVSMKLYPGSGNDYRNYTVKGELFINAMDGKVLHKGDTVKLKDAFDVEVYDVGKRVTAGYKGDNPGKLSRIQWITRDDAVKCELLIIGNLLKGEEFDRESIKRISGYAEGYSSGLRRGDIVQFEKLGYFRLDDKEKMAFISL